MLRTINKQRATESAGDTFGFPDLVLCIFYDLWSGDFVVNLWYPGNVIGYALSNDKYVARFHFDNLEEAMEMGEYILAKIALSDGLFGWIIPTIEQSLKGELI